MEEKVSVRVKVALVSLAFSSFIFNTSEFMPVALLSDIAESLSVSHSRAGLLISVYAWMVMLLSLPLMVAASRIPLRRLLLWVMGLFSVFQVCSALSYSYGFLMVSRIGVACAHSVFWAIVPVIAVRVTPAAHKSMALGLVATGSSLAVILGLPLGRAIGLAVGWRMTFSCVAAFAVLTFVFIWRVLPDIPVGTPFTLKRLPEMLFDKRLDRTFLFTLIFTTAYFTCYSYIEPFMIEVAGFTETLTTVALMVFGTAGIAGSVLFSRYYSRNPMRFFNMAIIGAGGCMALLLPASWSYVAMLALLILWGMSMMAFNISLQDIVITNSPEWSNAVSMATYSGIYNLGIGTGAFVGGLITDGIGVASVGWFGIAIATVAYVFWRLLLYPVLIAR